MILKPTPVSSKIFAFKDNTFISELSMFGDLSFTRVYDDACDFGFSVISEKTGNHVVFALDKDERDIEGDLVAIHFKCVTPGHKNLKAVLFND